MADAKTEPQTESGAKTVEQGEAGFGHLSTGKKTGVGLMGLMAALGLGGNVYQGSTADAYDATSLTEIQTGLTDVISELDERPTASMTQCMFLLADKPVPVSPTVALPVAAPKADGEDEVSSE